jgi:HK97 family phage portal protein
VTPYSQFICGHNGDALEVRNEATSGLRQPASWFYDWATGGQRNDAGVTVNGYTALTQCSLWQGVNIIAGDLGQVPIRLVKDDFFDQTQHSAWQLLRVRPNDLQTPSLLVETLMQWSLVWGNGVAWTPRVGPRITDLIPLRPDCLRPELVGYEGSQTLLYHYYSPVGNVDYTFFPWEVIHIQGLTSDGVWGYPLWQIAKNTIGHGLALQRHGNKQFSNGARPGGVLEHPAKLGDEARRNLRDEWNAVHGGANNAGKIAILWEGMKFNPISLTNVDAQWIEASKFNVLQVASLLNLPAHKLNALEDSSVRSNLEEQNEVYKQMTLTRWGNRMDQEFRRKLLTDSEWKSDRFRFKFEYDTFLRADIDTLTTVADRLVKATIINPNEARAMIGKPPREGGDEYGNPATAGQQPEDGAAAPNNGRPRNQLMAARNAHKTMIYDQILAILENESSRLKHAASNAKIFTQWLDEFYVGPAAKFLGIADAIMAKSVAACESVGLPVEYVQTLKKYAEKRHAMLLEACSNVTKEQLPAAIDELAKSPATSVAQGLLATALGEL